MYDKQLSITDSAMLILSPTTIRVVLTALAELPFRIAEPAIREMWTQLTPPPAASSDVAP